MKRKKTSSMFAIKLGQTKPTKKGNGLVINIDGSQHPSSRMDLRHCGSSCTTKNVRMSVAEGSLTFSGVELGGRQRRRWEQKKANKLY